MYVLLETIGVENLNYKITKVLLILIIRKSMEYSLVKVTWTKPAGNLVPLFNFYIIFGFQKYR